MIFVLLSRMNYSHLCCCIFFFSFILFSVFHCHRNNHSCQCWKLLELRNERKTTSLSLLPKCTHQSPLADTKKKKNSFMSISQGVAKHKWINLHMHEKTLYGQKGQINYLFLFAYKKSAQKQMIIKTSAKKNH